MKRWELKMLSIIDCIQDNRDNWEYMNYDNLMRINYERFPKLAVGYRPKGKLNSGRQGRDISWSRMGYFCSFEEAYDNDNYCECIMKIDIFFLSLVTTATSYCIC